MNPSAKPEESVGEYCVVRACKCGNIYLQVGQFKMKVDREAFLSIRATLNGFRIPEKGTEIPPAFVAWNCAHGSRSMVQ